MQFVFTYVEYPDRIRRILISDSEREAKLKLVQRGVRFKNFGIDPVKTFQLWLGIPLFSDKDYVSILRTVRRYTRNNRSVFEALKTASLSPDPNVSLLASILYERMLSGKSFAEAAEGIFPDYVVSLLKTTDRKESGHSLSLYEVLGFILELLESEKKTRTKLKPVIAILKTQVVIGIVGFIAVLTYAIPRLYKLALALNPYKKFSPFMNKMIALGEFFSTHVYVAIALGIALTLLVIKFLTAEKIFSFLNKLPGLRVAEALDKRMITGYTLLFVRLSIPPLEAIKKLVEIPKLPGIRKKLKKAYHKLYSRTDLKWGEFFETANVDRLLTVKTKTAGADLEDELQMLLSDYDELVEEQIEKTKNIVNLSGMVLVMGFVLFFAYVVFTLLYG